MAMGIEDALRKVIAANKGESRNALAKRAGIDASQLCRFMAGERRLLTENMEQLATALGLRIVIVKAGKSGRGNRPLTKKGK